MKLREFIGVFEQSERLRIVKDGKEIYTGYKALMEHAELEAVMDAEVKRLEEAAREKYGTRNGKNGD